eukprot:7511362-Pyramimonas_sp.AAC.1
MTASRRERVARGREGERARRGREGERGRRGREEGERGLKAPSGLSEDMVDCVTGPRGAWGGGGSAVVLGFQGSRVLGF